MSSRLPMFPLGAVLVPHGVLPLHIFEPRYRVLMFDCLRGDRRFGVVLIERGHEVGGGDQRFGMGTVAHIEVADELPDGRWLVVAEGVGRVCVDQWLEDDPYPVAMVSDRPELPFPGRGSAGAGRAAGEGLAAAEDGRAALAAAERAVRRSISAAEAQMRRSLGEMARVRAVADSTEFELAEDPTVAGWQLVALAPLASLDRQRLLEIDDPVARLRRLAEAAEDQVSLLGYGDGHE
ncbi:MAG: LON peptidase substrate-binding domain-containing protein [Acidimicrobiales bacterium]